MKNKKDTPLDWFLLFLLVLLMPTALYFFYEEALRPTVIDIQPINGTSFYAKEYVVTCSDDSIEIINTSSELACGRKINWDVYFKAQAYVKKMAIQIT